MFSQTEYGDSDGREEQEEGATSVASGRWYENDFGDDHICGDDDLFLAAELGKTLLERNRDLENQLRASQQSQWDLQNEVDLLTRQLEVLRSVGESRARLYEDVDKHLQEAEKANETLRQQAVLDKGKIERLNENVQSLESRCEDLSFQVTELKAHEREQRRHDKRTWSEPSLCDLPDDLQVTRSSYDYLGFPSVFTKRESSSQSKEISSLRETIKNLRKEVNVLKRRNENVDAELSFMTQENQNLTKKIEEFEEEERKREEFEEHRRTAVLCRECGGRQSALDARADQGLIEHDLSEIPHGELHRLKNGGSAYGSRESLHLLGLETEGMTPTVEIVRDILAADMGSMSGDEEDGQKKQKNGDDSPTGGGLSLLGELEEQYRRLVTRYESLIEAKNKRAREEQSSKDMATQVPQAAAAAASGAAEAPLKAPPSEAVRPTQLSLHPTNSEGQVPVIDFRSPLDPMEGRFENGPPEYKRLFKEIFETLRRSVVYDDDGNDEDEDDN